MRGIVSFDVETHLVQPGLAAPPVVCASVAWEGGSELISPTEADDLLERLLDSPDVIIAGQNIPYDFLCMAVRRPEIIVKIFEAYRSERVHDLARCEMLHDISLGMLGRDKRTGGEMIDPATGKSGRYSLSIIQYQVTGRTDAKANDEYRLRYAELEHVPMSEWPRPARVYPIDDAVNTRELAVLQRATRVNLEDLPAQCYAAWAIHLGSAWGFMADPRAVDQLERDTVLKRSEEESYFQDLGWLRQDGSKDSAKIKKRTVEAYGGSDPCLECNGTSKVLSSKTGKPIQCKACGASGYQIDGLMVPRTDKGGISVGRDSLYESGDEDLIRFAERSQTDKVLSTYIPWLRKGQKPDGTRIPITLGRNYLLASGRESYADVVQLLPRDMGIREALESRVGTLLCSTDYGGLELATHAQSCLWILQESKLAEALQKGVKVHDLLGSKIAGISYELFLERKGSDPFLKACRQSAKPINFGCPGGMGAPTLVSQQRKQGPDTTAPDGTIYKGLRFCLLTGGATKCGTKKTMEWNGRPCPPLCERCVQVADDLRDKWFELFPENREYFKRISQMDPPIAVQHVSGRIRLEESFCSRANTFFQGLAADGAKHALCNVSYESYCVRDSDLYGTRPILFAHDEIVAEVPVYKAHEAATRLAKVMVDSMQKYVPDIPITAEPVLMDRWYKNAEPVYDNGRLVPWYPSTDG